MAITPQEAARALKKLPDWAKADAQKVMDVTAFQVWRRASTAAPFRTGALRKGLQWESRPRSTRAVVGATPLAWYRRFLEYGTVKMAARPFIRPAAEAETADHQRRMFEALTRVTTKLSQPVGSGLL